MENEKMQKELEKLRKKPEKVKEMIDSLELILAFNNEKEDCKFNLQQLEMAITEKIEYHLNCLGIPHNIRGYSYLLSAITIAVKDRDAVYSITKVIYPRVAEQYETTFSAVERAIRDAINVAWSRCNLKILDSYFANTCSPNAGKATNAEFIALLADKVRNETREYLEAENAKAKLEEIWSNPEMMQVMIYLLKELLEPNCKENQAKYLQENYLQEGKIQKRVTYHLEQIGIPHNRRGHLYLLTGISLMVKENGDIQMVNKEMYDFIAKQYRTSPQSVRKCIRTAIRNSFIRMDAETLNKYFGDFYLSKKGRMTIEAFMTILANIVKKQIV